MDIEALAIANSLVGNAWNVAALEFAYAGGEWEAADGDCRVAIAGGRFDAWLDGRRIASHASHTLRRGQRLRLGGAADAVWGYLAVAGGFAITPQLGSRSTHARSGIGGLHGKRLENGDTLKLAADPPPDGPQCRMPGVDRETGPLRVVLGPQDDYFEPASIETFLHEAYRVTHQVDRMGYCLAGTALAHAKGHDIISDGLVPGSIQVPGTGQPIVLLRDCQTIGGYPKLATVISTDLGRLAQLPPGRTVTFRAVDVAEAQRLARAFAARLEAIAVAGEPVPPRPFWLLG
jgi:biotin-dependent carboxylase-like uncharacterized protein